MPKIYSKKDPCIFLLQFIDGTIRLSHLFCCINSASNFVIYYFNGTKFRQAWCEIYGSPFHYCVQEGFHWSRWGWNPLLSSKAFHTGIPPRSDVWMFDILTFTFRCLSMAQEHPPPFLASSWMNGYLTLHIHNSYVF